LLFVGEELGWTVGEELAVGDELGWTVGEELG